jgi:hypothetical protein
MPKYTVNSPIRSGGKLHPVGSTIELSAQEAKALGAYVEPAGKAKETEPKEPKEPTNPTEPSTQD